MISRSLVVDSLALLVGTLAFVGCAPGAGEEEHGPEPDEHHEEAAIEREVVLTPAAYDSAGIETAAAELRTLERRVRVTGSLAYDERRMAVATARVGGRIASVPADYGAEVAAGEVLAWIDSPDLGVAQADYRRARSLEQLHAAEVERARLLLAGEAISRSELLRREADWRAAQAELEAAEQKLHILGLSDADIAALGDGGGRTTDRYPVRSPLAGRVTERRAATGQVVAADEVLFVVADLAELWLFLDVFEKDLPAVGEGARVLLRCEAHPEDRFTGVVDFVGQVLDPHSRTAKARAVIDNRDGKLKPGMFVHAQISTPEPAGAPAALVVPAGATTRVLGRDAVFVATGERAFSLREVELGRRTEAWVEILSGLSEGEPVAVAGVFVLKSETLAGGLQEHHH